MLALALLASACAGPAPGSETGERRDVELQAQIADFQERLVLTGFLEAEEAQLLPVPRTRAGQVGIRWLERSGARVQAGQRVVELDSTSLSADLEDRKLAVVRADNELARAAAEAAEREAERAFEVDRRRVELAKAELAAGVPRELLSAREAEERALALRRATVALAKVEEELDAHRRATEADLEVRRLALDKTLREIAVSEEGIAELELRSPADGVLLVEDHPWEGRRLQVGDVVWPGMAVAQIPDLSTLLVVARLPDVDEGRLAPGMAGVCVIDAFPEDVLPCRVRQIGPTAEEEHRDSLRRFFRVVLDAEGVDPERMRPGMSVRAEVVLQSRSQVLVVPRAGIWVGEGGPRVRIQGAWRPVEIGRCNALECTVLSGLESGERLERVEDGG